MNLDTTRACLYRTLRGAGEPEDTITRYKLLAAGTRHRELQEIHLAFRTFGPPCAMKLRLWFQLKAEGRHADLDALFLAYWRGDIARIAEYEGQEAILATEQTSRERVVASLRKN
jgi:hypothetical protein